MASDERNTRRVFAVRDVDVRRLPLMPTDGFVLSRVSGSATIEELILYTGLAPDEVTASVAKLVALGALSEPDAAPALVKDAIDLEPERRKTIDELFARLGSLDHYELLGVPRSAARSEIRSRYFAMSKEYHPDTLFRRDVGPYRPKIEAIFKCITAAYEELSRGDSRLAYDTAHPEKRSSAPPTHATTSSVPPVMKKPTIDEVRDRVKQRLGSISDTPARPSSRPSTPPGGSSATEAAHEVARSLAQIASLTGGGDRVSRLVGEAKQKERAGDLDGAFETMSLARALAQDRADVGAELERLRNATLVRDVDKNVQRAKADSDAGKISASAAAWGAASDGAPVNVDYAMAAADAIVRAKGDLHEARRYAQRAIDLEPKNAHARIVMGRVYLGANLLLNARRELELAVTLDPASETAKNLLRRAKGSTET